MALQRFRRLVSTATVMLALPLATVAAQQATLPAASDLVARHVAAIGGRDAIIARKSVHATGTFEMPAMGLRGDFDMAQSSGGAMLVKLTVPGLGDIQSGSDGSVAWAMDPMMGPRLLDGREAAQAREEANLRAVLREAPSVTSVETTEIGTVGEERCYKVRVTWASGRQAYDCYSVDSGLLIGTQSSVESPMGAVDVTTTIRDYRDFGGLKMATTTTVSAAGQERILRVVSYEFDNVEPATFALPTAIAALVQQRTAPPR